jgi:hypothetical protein
MYEFYVCSHYVPEVQYTLSADTILTGQGKTRRVDLYNGTTNHNGVEHAICLLGIFGILQTSTRHGVYQVFFGYELK